MAIIGVRFGGTPNTFSTAYSVGSALANDSNTAAINAARTQGYLESLGHTNALHDQQAQYYGAKTDTERQGIEGRNKAAAAAKALAESNAVPSGTGAAPAPVDPRAKQWGDLAYGSQLQSNSATDAASAGLKTTGGAGVVLNTDPTAVRRNMSLLGQTPNENTVVGANDTVWNDVQQTETSNKIREENSKQHVHTLGNGLVNTTTSEDGSVIANPIAGAENTRSSGPFNDSDKGSARNTLLDPNASPEAKKLAEQALAGSDGGGDPMYSGGFDSKTVDGQARNFINNYNDISEDDPRRQDPKVMRRYQEAIDIVRGKSDHWSTTPQGQQQHVVEKGPLPPNAVAPANLPEDGTSISTYGNKKPVDLNEWQSKAGVYGSQMALNGAAFDKVTPANIPGTLKQYLMNNQFNEEGAPISLKGLTPAQQKYVEAAVSYLVPGARFESGATVLKGEYMRKWLSEIPLNGDDAAELENKRSRRTLAISNLADSLPDGHPMKERMLNIMKANGMTQDQIKPISLGGGAADVGIDPKAVEMLKADPNTAAQFDEIFGQGSAAKVLGNGR